ncbi:MAG: ThuA domain-containing protein [Lentisphaeria bacterium]|nr:ThuA domain-containing protein [Lentisphaeria bacterium]
MIRVTIWNEFIHEQQEEAVRALYPDGIHGALASGLRTDDLRFECVTMDDPDQGLSEAVLNRTDVLVYWAHWGHARMEDVNVRRAAECVRNGMGLVVLHSGHYSKLFQTLCGTTCALEWRAVGEKERVWCVAPDHPIAEGVPQTFVVPHSEMYGEPFDIPEDAKPVFMSWFEGGNVFRSGITLKRGFGRIFYFEPGHEKYPIFYQPEVLRVIGNAVRWAAPRYRGVHTTPKVENLEPIRTE